ncbi:MAG: short-chain dehydrogenase/reductase [Glaciihabitans sp.]|nr:short-chain dehydrogenase/reductase [Glaciihabitans sp.]
MKRQPYASLESAHNLSGQTALVTGATSGIGRAVALELALAGADMIVHGRNEARGAALVDELKKTGVDARFVSSDLTDADGAIALADLSRDVDILVSAAGIWEFGPTSSMGAASFDRQFAINVRAPFLLVATIAPRMAKRGRGAIVTISSSASTSPAPERAAYGASKAAVDLLTRSWAMEFGASGVRVNAVAPGPVRTAGTEAMLGDKIDELGMGNVRGSAADPQEIAAIVRFLVEPASSYINGSILLADGGALSSIRQ